MDMLCFDYTNEKNALYLSEKGKELLDSKDLFMSTKLKHTFSGYAMSQLNRIRGHNKWMTQFPGTDVVLLWADEMFKKKRVDYNWLTDNLGGSVAEKVTGETSQENVSLPRESLMTWEQFVDRINQAIENYNRYRVPRLVDYMTAYDLTHTKLDMTDLVYVNNEPLLLDGGSVTLKHFLNNNASFRKFGESVLAVYTDGNGLFGREGNLKANDSEYLGEFVCLVSVNHNQYKADKDHVNKMWNWKCNRNEKRSALEEKHGYDTKHASHLVRLMEGARDILSTGKYTPELSGDRLKFVQDVRNGEYTYEWLLNYAEELDKSLEKDYKNSGLQKKPNHKKVNELVLKLQKDS